MNVREQRRPATTDEARENQIIAAAVNLAEKQILEGTASSQVIVHYLKLGTTKERKEKEKLECEVELLRAKTEALKSAKNVEELYAKALGAIKDYRGSDEEDA